MSHDTDKLIRQLSLVAFLMAERRPITARDVKQNVEGYSEMSDEAFARRFYADRAELIGARRPARLAARRVHRRGAVHPALGALLPARSSSSPTTSSPPSRPSLYLLEGQFAYAEPLRLALQNLALGRPGFDPPPTDTAERVDVRDPDYSPEMPGRLAKLESAISKQRTVKFEYWSINRDEERERTINPYALLPENGVWYVIGQDLDDERRKKFRVSRVRSDIRLATRRERDFRVPDRLRHRRLPRAAELAGRRPRRRGPDRGRRTTPPGGSSASTERRAARGRRLRHRRTRACRCWPPGSCARTVAPSPSIRRSCVPRSSARSSASLARTRAALPTVAEEARRRAAEHVDRRPARWHRSASASSRRCSPTCSTAAASETEAEIPAAELVEALPHSARVARGASVAAQPRQLRRRLLRDLRRAARRHRLRPQGALRRHVPLAAAPDAARGPRDPARARLRRPDDRRRHAQPARQRAREAARRPSASSTSAATAADGLRLGRGELSCAR